MLTPMTTDNSYTVTHTTLQEIEKPNDSTKGMSRREKADLLKQATAERKGGLLVPETFDVYKPDQSVSSGSGGGGGNNLPVPSQIMIPNTTALSRSYGSVDYGEMEGNNNIADIRLDPRIEDETTFKNNNNNASNAVVPPVVSRNKNRVRTKHAEYELLLAVINPAHPPIIPSHSYLTYNKYASYYIQNVAIDYVNCFYTYNFASPAIQPSCVELLLVANNKNKRASKSSISATSNTNTNNAPITSTMDNNMKVMVLPQYIYVGLVDGPVYKIVM